MRNVRIPTIPACPQMSSSSPLLPRGVRRGIDAMRANVERNWNAVDLAAVAGVSSRTLQRQFRSFLGKVPRAVLRDVRLECARRELLQGPPDTKVMDVALRCGFPHFGRFSSEYRRRYSETPSQTLKRQAVFIDGLASMPSLLASGRDRPTVAVCPFEADPENRALARSIADELATALTRSGASVASEARSARYHLTGIMRGPAGQARLTLRLIETETSRHLWAHRADGALGDGDSAAEEHLAMRVAAALRPCMLLAEIDRATRKPDSDLSPHDLTLRAMPGVLSLDAEGNARALELLERATDRDPDHALALALAAWAYVQRVVYHFAARSTPARRGPGAAAGGSTCTRETPSRRSSGSRLHLILRRMIPLPSTIWWGSAVRILRRAGISMQRVGRSAHSSSTHRRSGSIGRSVPRFCWEVRRPKPAVASRLCGNNIRSSRSRTCDSACHRLRRRSAILLPTLCTRLASRRRCPPPVSGELSVGHFQAGGETIHLRGELGRILGRVCVINLRDPVPHSGCPSTQFFCCGHVFRLHVDQASIEGAPDLRASCSDQQTDTRSEQKQVHRQREGSIRQAPEDGETEPSTEKRHRNELEGIEAHDNTMDDR